MERKEIGVMVPTVPCEYLDYRHQVFLFLYALLNLSIFLVIREVCCFYNQEGKNYMANFLGRLQCKRLEGWGHGGYTHVRLEGALRGHPVHPPDSDLKNLKKTQYLHSFCMSETAPCPPRLSTPSRTPREI